MKAAVTHMHGVFSIKMGLVFDRITLLILFSLFFFSVKMSIFYVLNDFCPVTHLNCIHKTNTVQYFS